MNNVAVVSLNSKHRFYEKKIKKTVQEFLRLLKKKNCYLDVFLISSSKMKFLNKKFRGKNKTTSILTFVEPKNFPHPESELKYLGEIYLNIGYIPSEDLNRLIAHGLLHLFGFQHTKKGDRMKMEAKENFLISHV